MLEQPAKLSASLCHSNNRCQLNNKIATSELGFICDRRNDDSTSVGVILIPFDGAFENHQDVVPVVIQKSANQNDPFDLLQKWKNGTEYIFLESTDDINELASLLKAEEIDSEKSTHFFFQTMVAQVLKIQTISLLMFRGSPMASALSNRHAPHLNKSLATAAFWVVHSADCNDSSRYLRYGMRSCQMGVENHGKRSKTC